ncbi:MAG: hypothetical protein M3Y80_00275, partial [Verrucomicrobiota bacterium]|nr:hypothetical protein [Verrucomicrobiota bacterium]
MNSLPRPSSAGWILLPLALLLTAASTFAQTPVGSFIHGKIQNFQQTSTTAPVADPVQPFQFGSLVAMGTATINSATLTFSGSASPRAYTGSTSGDFSILDTFTTQAQLDAAYPTSTYNLAVNTTAGPFSKSISYFAFFGYPPTPRLTVPAASWQNGAIVIDPTADYTLTWGAFTGAQATDAIQLAIAGSGLSLSPFPATQTSYTIPAGSLQPNTNYACELAFLRVAGATAADANFGAGYATLVRKTAFTIHTIAPALTLTAAASRKTHGTGTFDINLPLGSTPGVECRSGGGTGDHTLVIGFSNPIATATANITGGTATVVSTAISGNTVTVNLTGVADVQTVTVTLSDITDTFAQALPDIAI